MDFYTSYFYQIRNFTPNMIPLSTACGDPAWYHAGRDKNFVYFDNNKVCNGLRAEMLHPDKSCANLCCGGFACPYTPDTCNFLLSVLFFKSGCGGMECLAPSCHIKGNSLGGSFDEDLFNAC